MSTRAEVVTPALLRGWQVPRDAESKNDRGSILVVGGARRTPGAAMLAGLAALRAGAGRLTLAVAESTAVATAVALPEAGVIGLPENAAGSVLGSDLSAAADELAGADVVLVGPGLDDAGQTAVLLRSLAPSIGGNTLVVLDAYALGVLPGLEDLYPQWAGRLLLTPNPAEAERLLAGKAAAGKDLSAAAVAIARRYAAVVSVQGAVADADDGLWQVPAGSAGLGTSGSGDVLVGAAGGLLARGAAPAQAACWATYAHATAGDRLGARIGPVNYLARELLDELPRVMAELTF